MAVENIKSTPITNLEAKPPSYASAGDAGGGSSLRRMRDYVTTTGTTTTNTSTYKCCPIPSNAIIEAINVRGDGTIDCPNVDVGMAHPASDSYLDDDSIATALDIDDTGDHYAIGNVYRAAAAFKAAWEYLDSTAVTKDPGGMCYIHLSLDADAVVAGTMEIVVDYFMPSD